jgi:hypothetical protein
MICIRKLFFAAGAAALSAGIYSSAASAVTINANATATVIDPLGVTEVNGMSFGDISATATAGTVVLDLGDGRTFTGGVDLAGGTVTSGDYTLTGEPNKAYVITFPASATITSGTDTMTVNTFTTSKGSTAPITGTLDGTGNDSFIIGGTLIVGGNQPAGTYSGSYVLTVEYQ